MIDELIASDLAVLAREDQQHIPAFARPTPREKPRRLVLPRAIIAAVAPIVAMLAVGVALVELDVAPFGVYETFLAPFIVAIASLVGLATEIKPESALAHSRRQASYVLAGAALLIALVVCFFVGWPGTGTAWLRVGDEAIYAMVGGETPPLLTSVGFISIMATLAFVVARVISQKLDARLLETRRNLEAWGTAGLVTGVLVVVIWTSALFFAMRYWYLVSFRLPDPTLRFHLVEATKAKMWVALQFRPWAESSISNDQWTIAIASACVVGVAIASCVAIAREARRGRPSRWLRLLEFPVLVPVLVIIGMCYVVATMAADSPHDAARPFAVASAAVMLAFTSMILRRRRRRALS